MAERKRGSAPYLCRPDALLPRGWQASDPLLDVEDIRLAFDPRRHTVVRYLGQVTDRAAALLERAGFERLDMAGIDGVYVRDRRNDAPARLRPTPSAEAGLSR